MGILYYSFHYPPLLLLRHHPVAELLPGKLPLPHERVLAEGAVALLWPWGHWGPSPEC